MKNLKLLGYYETKQDFGPGFEGHNEGHRAYHFVLEDGSDKYVFTAKEDYGSCPSGWTSATYGSISENLQEYTGNLPLIVPVKAMFVPVQEWDDGSKNVIFTEKDPEEMGDAMMTCVSNQDGECFVYSTGNGGCQWYPSGMVRIDENLFVPA